MQTESEDRGEDKTEQEINMQTGQAEGAVYQGRKANNLCRACKLRDRRQAVQTKGGRRRIYVEHAPRIDMQTDSADRSKTQVAETQQKIKNADRGQKEIVYRYAKDLARQLKGAVEELRMLKEEIHHL